jgi:5-methylcytosine-specific restriction endonuclease McrA
LPDGRRCPQNQDLEVHHIISRRQGGTDDVRNLKTVCKDHHPRGDRLSVG